MAPVIALVPAFVAFSIVPVGGTITVAGYTTRLQLADPPWGILVMLMASSISVYGVMLAGWASGSKYPLMGSVRASAQMISYEAALGLSVATVVVLSGSLHTSAIVAAQHGGFLYHWNILRAASGPRRHILHRHNGRNDAAPLRPRRGRGGARRRLQPRVLVDRLRAVLPGRVHGARHQLAPSSPPSSSAAPTAPASPATRSARCGSPSKVLVLLYIYVWIRATLPRLRYDQLMDLGWKRLIPGSLGRSC